MYFIPLPGYVSSSCARRSNNRFRSDTGFKILQNPKEGEDDCTRARLCQKHRHFFLLSHTSTFQLLDKPWSQVSSLLPPRYLSSMFIAHRVQQSHCSSIVHRVLLTHALALSASQLVRTRKCPNEFIRACSRRGSNSRN